MSQLTFLSKPPDQDVEARPLCKKCGHEMWEYVDCWNGCDEGYFWLYDEDPLWYDKDEQQRCDICSGKGGWLVCAVCHPEALDDYHVNGNGEPND